MAENGKLFSKVGIGLKQRLREAVWKTKLENDVNQQGKLDDAIVRKLQPFYRESYIKEDGSNAPKYIHVRARGTFEVITGHQSDNLKEIMKVSKLPGAQITFQNGESPTIAWFCWHNEYIFADGDIETISEDPFYNRSFSLDNETQNYLKIAIMSAVQGPGRMNLKESVFLTLRNLFPETYRKKFVNIDLMPFITINEMCVIDITDRNCGFVMNADVLQMKKYMHELLIPGVLTNFTDGVLTTIVWFSCKNSKLEMEIEILEEIPKETLNLRLEENMKKVIRDSVTAVHSDESFVDTKTYKEELYNRLKSLWPHTYKDKFQNGHIPDITIEGHCILDIKIRHRGIVMTKDRFTMKDSMLDLEMPAVQINFIDGSSVVILWFSCKNRSMHIEMEAPNEDPKNAPMVNVL